MTSGLGERSDDLEVPEGLLMALVKSLGEKPSGSVEDWLHNRFTAVWACAKLNFYHEELLVSVAQRLKSGDALKTFHWWNVCSLLWSYDVLDPDDRFAEFKGTLESERLRLGVTDSDVSTVQLGYFEWQWLQFEKLNQALANWQQTSE